MMIPLSMRNNSINPSSKIFYYNQYIKRKMSYENEEYELEWGDGDQNEGWD